MYVIKKVLYEARIFLKRKFIESWSLDAELLLMHILNFSREELVANRDKEISFEDYENLQQILNQRSNNIPVSHLIKSRQFWENDFIVTPDTLDPRSDSETLIESVLFHFPNKSKNYNILELGIGSGCLLLTLLSEYSNSRGVGVDISKKALDISILNAEKLDLLDRVDFLLSDWCSSIKGKFDIIISNPPYIKTTDIASLQPEVKLYEPLIALDGGEDGLKCYLKILPCLKILLSKTGVIFLEHGKGQEKNIINLLEKESFTIISQHKDINNISRVIVSRQLKK